MCVVLCYVTPCVLRCNQHSSQATELLLLPQTPLSLPLYHHTQPPTTPNLWQHESVFCLSSCFSYHALWLMVVLSESVILFQAIVIIENCLMTLYVTIFCKYFMYV